MIHRTFTLSLLATASVLPTMALAQDETVIVVTGQGLEEPDGAIAYDTVELERERITASASGRIEDVLANVAGFQQFRRSDSRSSNPTAQGVTLRALGGNASSRALVTLDGVPLTDPFFGYVPLSALAPERLGRISVTRGGGAGPFGAGALAGVIALESAGPVDLAPVQASGAINERAETELFGSVAPRVGDGMAVLSGKWDRGQGFHTTPRDQRVPASARAAFESWSASARVAYPVGPDVELQARALAFEDERTLRFDGADSRIEGQDASLRLVGRGRWQFDVLGYGQWRDFSNIVISSTRFTPVLDQKDTPSSGYGGKVELRPPLGVDQTLRLGSDLRVVEGEIAEDRISAFTGALTGSRYAGGRNSDVGLYAEYDRRFGPLVLTGGVRADRYRIEDGFLRDTNAAGAVTSADSYSDRADWALSWRGGAALEASDTLQLRAAAYRSLRLPTLNELYRPFVVFPITTEANPDLRPERLTGFEIGADWTVADGIAFSLTAFDNRLEKAVANVSLTPTLRQRQNLPAIDAQGLEGALGIVRNAWRFDASLAWTDATIDGSGQSAGLDEARPPQSPKFAASATIAYAPRESTRAALTLRHVSRQFEDDSGADVLPAATTLDAFVQVPLAGELSAVFRGENLLDERIVTRNSGGSVDLGAPRTVWAGLRYGF
ncbi:TonB-dependent receptor [Altererythrobacter sp. CAU 1778]